MKKAHTLSIRTFLFFVSVLFLFGCCFMTSLFFVVFRNTAIRVMLLLGAAFLFVLLEFTKKNSDLPQLAQFFLVSMCSIIALGVIRVNDREWEASIRFILFYLIFLVGMRDQRWIRLFWVLSIVTAMFYIVTTIWLSIDTGSVFRYFGQRLYPNETRFSFWVNTRNTPGVTDHYSTNGMALANATVMAAGGTIARTKKKGGRAYAVLLVLAYIALFLTGKRAHLLFTTASIGLAVYVYGRYEKNNFIKYLILIIVTILSIVLAYALIPQVTTVLNRFIGMEDDGNLVGRYMWWAAAYESFLNHKWIGIGWFGFRNIVAPTVFYTGHAHNIYIQLLCETGIVGTIIFVSWFLYAFIISTKFLQYIAKNKMTVAPYFSTLALFCMIYQGYFLMYGLTGNPLYDPYVYPIYLVACVIPIYYLHNKQKILFHL